MTRDQVIELLRAADPMSESSSESESFPSVTTLLDRIDERSTDVQTQVRRAEAQPEHSPQRKRRRLVAALAGGVAALGGVVVAVALVTAGDDPASPAEVGEAMNLAVMTGDLEAMRSLYADDATFTDLASTLLAGSGRSVENIPFSTSVISTTSPYDRPEPVWPAFGPREWDVDGDGVRTIFDVQLMATATEYAAGVTRLHTCTQTGATTIVCEDVLEGWPFLTEPSEYQVTNTYTVVDGLITHRVLDYTNATGKKLDAARVISYQEWVRANRPELENRLFSFFGSLAIGPSTIETHRQTIAEWKAQS